MPSVAVLVMAQPRTGAAWMRIYTRRSSCVFRLWATHVMMVMDANRMELRRVLEYPASKQIQALIDAIR